MALESSGMSPQVVTKPQALQALIAGQNSVGFVPTLGFLHEGHAHLIRRAKAENELVVVSVFVNPLQFGTNEDLELYPRNFDHDLAIAKEAGTNVMFHPSEEMMYPPGFSSKVTMTGVSQPLDGASRPGHFDGVATIVLKLLNLVRPDCAYFGEKDWQQLQVIRRMVTDFHLPYKIIGVPTVRDETGLALSSRNSYLNDEQRTRAAIISQTLSAVQAAYQAGERRTDQLRKAGLQQLQQEPEIHLDYLSIVNSELLEEEIVSDDPMNRVLIAVKMFGVRLIDNMPLQETHT